MTYFDQFFTGVDASVLQRLALCADEIDGIKKGYPIATRGASYSTPYMYGVMGAMRRGETNSTSDTRSWERRYQWRLVVKNVDDGINTAQGLEAVLEALPYVTLVHDYIQQHPHLHTLAEQDLPFLKSIKAEDDGPRVRDLEAMPSKGVRIDFVLTIQFGKQLSRLPQPTS